jgi:MFS family permease
VRTSGVRREAPYAWVIVAISAAMVGMAFGAIVNVAVFLTPLAADFGWPRADLSLAYAVASIAAGLGGILLGHFSDRIPVRRVVLCGAVITGVSFLLLARLGSTLELYLYHALLGLVGVGAIMAPLNNLASSWLSRPALAIGIVSAGGALGQGLMPFLSRQLVLTTGWRQAYLTLGLLYLAVMIPLALLVRDSPRAVASVGAGAQRAVEHRFAASPVRLLTLLSIAVVFCCVCMATPIVHVAALGSDLGLGGRDAAGLLAVMMVFGMAGRVAFGGIADRFGNLQSYIIASLGQTALAFLFPYAATRMELYALSAVFGIFFSGAMTSFISCAREYSPPRNTGLSIGVIMFFGWAGMALGAWQGGLFYDLCGNYYPSFANASIGGVVNLLILALLYQNTRSLSSRGSRSTRPPQTKIAT